jgi:hypothetical protein
MRCLWGNKPTRRGGRTIAPVEAPPIAITCECGAAGSVPLGETWACEECGRRWSTAQIPADEYRRRLRSLRRFKLEAGAILVVLAAVFVPLIVLVDQSVIFLAAIASFGYLFLYMPFWRRRVRRAVRDAPRWQLTPE